MVQVEGYWKVRVVCLIVLIIIIAALWVCGESSSNQEAHLLSSCSNAFVFVYGNSTDSRYTH